MGGGLPLPQDESRTAPPGLASCLGLRFREAMRALLLPFLAEPLDDGKAAA